jgi:hypothetical protein
MAGLTTPTPAGEITALRCAHSGPAPATRVAETARRILTLICIAALSNRALTEHGRIRIVRVVGIAQKPIEAGNLLRRVNPIAAPCLLIQECLRSVSPRTVRVGVHSLDRVDLRADPTVSRVDVITAGAERLSLSVFEASAGQTNDSLDPDDLV